MAKRPIPQPNTSSTADIAFLLLIFFLITTTMNTDTGLSRRLPPPVAEEVEQKVEDRNVLVVLVSSANDIMVDGKISALRDVKKAARRFILNEGDEVDLPKRTEIEIPYFGKVKVTKNHVISLQNDRGTTYQVYLNVQNELVAAYNELREEASKQKFGKSFDDLSKDEKDAVIKYYPQKISEAEPKNYGGNK